MLIHVEEEGEKKKRERLIKHKVVELHCIVHQKQKEIMGLFHFLCILPRKAVRSYVSVDEVVSWWNISSQPEGKLVN